MDSSFVEKSFRVYGLNPTSSEHHQRQRTCWPAACRRAKRLGMFRKSVKCHNHCTGGGSSRHGAPKQLGGPTAARAPQNWLGQNPNNLQSRGYISVGMGPVKNIPPEQAC